MHIVIVGDGKVGSTVAAQLSTEGHDIIIIDSNATALENAGNTMDIILSLIHISEPTRH